MADINSIWQLDHDTIIKLQEKIGTKADGMIGQNTIKKLQAWLNNESNAGLVEDGKLGPKTIKALQSFVGVEADGSFGPATAKAVRDAGLRLDLEAPSPEYPSITAAIAAYVKKVNGID